MEPRARNLRRVLRAATIACALVAAQASTADAATVAYSAGAFGDSIAYTGVAAEANNVAVTFSGGNYVFTETGGGVALADGDGAGGCSVAANVGTCPSLGVQALNVNVASGADTVDASAITPPGSMSITGGAGVDSLTGSGSGDTLSGGDEPDTLSGGPGVNSLRGNAGDDLLIGGPDRDTMSGGAGADTMGGLGGDDDLLGGAGADTQSGGPGRDRGEFDDHANDVVVSHNGAADDGEAGEGDNVMEIEELTGGSGNDTLPGTAAPNQIEGGPGNDTITGEGGSDDLEGDAGNDAIDGGADGDDLNGGSGDDNLGGGDGDDDLNGGPGGDFVGGGPGFDDDDSFFNRAEPVTITPNGQPDDGASGEGDNVQADVENLGGGSGNDVIRAGNGPNSISGGDGDDDLSGGGGDDSIDGGDGNDQLAGDAGDDFLGGGEGADVQRGGSGVDGTGFFFDEANVTVTLDNRANDGRSGERDNVRSDVENVSTGDGDDRITGSRAANDLSGGGGNDRVSGGAGNDELEGGDGNDRLAGGSGRDELLGRTGNDALDLRDSSLDVAESGALALDRIRSTDYDAIVADIRMPGMDGLALLNEIRALRRGTPTLLITGHGEHELAIEALRRGAYDYIQKPIDREYFVASLRRAIEMRLLARQVEHQRQTLERHSEELAEQVRALTEVAAAIHQARGVEEVLEAVAAAGTRLVGGTVFAAIAREPTGPGLADGTGEDHRRWEASSSPSGALTHLEGLQVRALFELVADGRKIVRADEVHGLGGGGRGTPSIGSYLAAPILDRAGAVLGAIYFGHPEPHRFTPELQRQIEALTRQAAVALENSLHYQRQRGIAETLQFSLLPERLPTIPGVTMAARYLPGPTEAVGGDWYDVFPLPAGRTGIVMGDVSGRGVQAAAVMGQLRNALRAYALEGHGPATVGRHLRRVLEPGQMATVIYLIFDPQSWSLQFANLGHPPPVVVTPGSEPVFLHSGNPPLGADLWAPVSEETAPLAPGSILLVYTDGLIEVRGESLDAGLDRLRQAVARVPDGDPNLDALIESVVGDVLNGRVSEDDVALLAIRAGPLDPHRLTLRLPAVSSSSPLLRHSLDRWLQLQASSPEDIYEITVATCEAFGNAVEHAYGPIDATVDVEAIAGEGAVEVIVRDSGRWRSPRGTHRGRGLELMRRLMDGLEITRGAEGTTVRMRKVLHLPRPEMQA